MRSRQARATALGALVGGRSGLGGAITGAAIGHMVGHAVNVRHEVQQHQSDCHGDHHYGVQQYQEQCEKTHRLVSSLRCEIHRLQDQIKLLSHDLRAKMDQSASYDFKSLSLRDLSFLYSFLTTMASHLRTASHERGDYAVILQKFVNESEEEVHLPFLASDPTSRRRTTLMDAWEGAERKCANHSTELGLVVTFVCRRCTKSLTEFPHVSRDGSQLLCSCCHSLTEH